MCVCGVLLAGDVEMESKKPKLDNNVGTPAGLQG